MRLGEPFQLLALLEVPLTLLALSAEPIDFEHLASCLADESTRAPGLVALASSGQPAAVDLALPFLADPVLGRLAGEVVCAIAPPR